VRSFKSAATKRINELRNTPGLAFWQRNYYEHIVRNHADLQRIRRYIAQNPARWARDRLHPGTPPNHSTRRSR
jgi:REP element-mobilizing transposase RayT